MKTYVLGIAYDEYTPKVQARLYRDLRQVQSNCYNAKCRLAVVGTDDTMDWLLGIMGIPRIRKMKKAVNWLVYYVDELPELPKNAKDIIEIRIPEGRTSGRMVTTPLPNPEIPKEPGRDATFVSMIDRPMPNAYTPTAPSPIAIWFGT